MARSFLIDPSGLRQKLAARFRRRRGEWLAGGGAWPLRLPLGAPPEAAAVRCLDDVRQWVDEWNEWRGPGEIEWRGRRWPSLGDWRLPEAIAFPGPQAVCAALNETGAWSRAQARLDEIGRRWPVLAPMAARNWDLLAEWADVDFNALMALMVWLHEHPDSGLYPRQIPVPGVDGKWLERHRRIVRDWLGALRGGGGPEGDLFRMAGLRGQPVRLRLRLLDPALRARLGGLEDIEAPLEDVAALDLPLRRAFIVENLQTGLAFGELAGAVVFMRQGYAVDVFGALPWLRRMPTYYWGDIDTHGLAILDRLRRCLPGAQSLLMDEGTLLAHRSLWGHEAKPAGADGLPRLTAAEAALYRDLRAGRWGPGVRLEQERIGWPFAWRAIAALTDGRKADA